MTSPLPLPAAPGTDGGILSEGLLLGVVFITARAAHLPRPLVVIGKGRFPPARARRHRRVPPEMTQAGDALGRHLARLAATIILFLFRARFSPLPFWPTLVLSFPRGPASRSGDGAGGSCSCPPFIPFVSSCFCPFAHGNLPSSPAVSLCLPALRCECLPAWQFGYPKLARYGYSQKAGGGRDGMAAVPIRPRGGGGSSRPVTA